MSILIQGVGLNGEKKDIWIEGNRIGRIADRIEEKAEIVISGRDKIAIPPFINGHTHAAMTLLRGYADDMPLQEWLLTKIWPVEAHLTEEDVYWGVKLVLALAGRSPGGARDGHSGRIECSLHRYL